MKSNIAKYICDAFGHRWRGCICSRCRKTDSGRDTHNWDGCRCTGCHKDRHTWLEWDFVQESSCWQKATCERCAESKNMEHHNFTYQMKNSCIGTRTCSRCGRTEDVEDHSFRIESTEMYDVDHDMNNLVCTRCGFQTFEAWRVLPL